MHPPTPAAPSPEHVLVVSLGSGVGDIDRSAAAGWLGFHLPHREEEHKNRKKPSSSVMLLNGPSVGLVGLLCAVPVFQLFTVFCWRNDDDDEKDIDQEEKPVENGK